MTTSVLATAEDLLRMPHGKGFRHELVRGKLRTMAAAGHTHGSVIMNLAIPLGQYIMANDLGRIYAAETGFKLEEGPDTVLAPDVAFVRRERAERVADGEGFWPGAPDLAVEVVSPSDRYSEVQEKVLAWLDAGTQMVVVVSPQDRAVTVYRSRTDVVVLGQDATLDGKDVVPGWSMPVRPLFE